MKSRAAYMRAWWAAHPEKRKAATKAYKAYHQEWYRRNRERLLAKQSAYRKTAKGREVSRVGTQKWSKRNPEKIRLKNKLHSAKRAILTKCWYSRHPERRRERDRRMRQTSIHFCIKDRIRRRINQLLKKKGIDKTGRTEAILGCSIDALRTHLESLFLPGMRWENRSRWHIDHIRPCASFDLADPGQQKICFHYTNLQPLWRLDNLRKGARDDYRFVA